MLAPPAALWRARPRPLRRLVLGHAPPFLGGGRLPCPAGDSVRGPCARRRRTAPSWHFGQGWGFGGLSSKTPFFASESVIVCYVVAEACKPNVFSDRHCHDLGFDSALCGIPFFPFLVNWPFSSYFAPFRLSRPWAGGVCGSVRCQLGLIMNGGEGDQQGTPSTTWDATTWDGGLRAGGLGVCGLPGWLDSQQRHVGNPVATAHH